MIELPDEVGGVGTPPTRYQTNSDIIKDVFDVIDAYHLTYYEGHAFKYLVRRGKKGTDESNLGKCLHFLRESEKRAPVRAPFWVQGHPEGMPPSVVLAAFDLGEVEGIARRILMSHVDDEPRYWFRAAAEELEDYMESIGIAVQRSS